jgi:Tol biopolymer transport system component
METFPCWSPGGDHFYYCRTKQVDKNFDYRKIKYDLVRKSFDQKTGLFGDAEIVFNAREINKSVSLPRVSPDGKYLVFTLHDYGTSSVYHTEADLYVIDLLNGRNNRMSINSDETESYHSWSSNSKWLVFSSRRGDGFTSRPYIAYFSSPDHTGKPFVLPQKDPTLYNRMEQTFNRPELLTGKIKAGPRDFAGASKKEPEPATWIDTKNPQ